MTVARKIKAKSQIKTFHATMLVTRAEEWWVEAASPQEAQALLAAGEGHRAAIGERLHVEIDTMVEEDV